MREQKPIVESIKLSNSGFDVIAIYQRSNVVHDRVKEALEKVVTLRDRLAKTSDEKERREQRLKEISEEQARIRQNLQA